MLTSAVIGFLKKFFNYAFSQTKGNAAACKARIEQITPHCFGCHDKCGDWCCFIKDPESYKHGTLTKDLQGDVLRQDLELVFRSFSQNAEKIASGGSTKDVEWFHCMVASKAPNAPKKHRIVTSS